MAKMGGVKMGLGSVSQTKVVDVVMEGRMELGET